MKQPTMMAVLLASSLFFQCHTSVDAVPVSKHADDGGVGDSSLEDTLGSLFLDEGPAEQSLAGGGDGPRGRTGGPRVMVLMGDPALLKRLRALDGGLPIYKQQRQQRPGDSGLAPEQLLGQEPGMALHRRDTMRCMVGRVYRPCWEA